MKKPSRSYLQHRGSFSLSAGLISIMSLAGYAHAQASGAASRTIGLSAFAGVEGTHPEFNNASNIYGFLIGGDFTRYYKLVSPSLEVRYSHASSTPVSQSSFLVGVKAEHSFGPEQRLHPYIIGLVGPGTSHFEDPGDPTYNHDTSLVFGAGAGIDVDLTRQFSLKGEIQIQRWHLGQESPVFSPETVSVAFVYHPFAGKLITR